MDSLGDMYNLHMSCSLFDTHYKEDQNHYLEVGFGVSPVTFARNKGPLISIKFRRVILDVYLQLCILFVNIQIIHSIML